jgi:hypothetical protein
MSVSGPVISWLLDSDPSVRWQVMRDLLDPPEPEWRAERAKVETEGWGARLLSCEDEDGQWAGGAFFPSDFEAREWWEVGQPYWEGEVEECINGRTVADGAYFGVDVSSIAGRLVGERLDDGGWNCERANGSVRSSFATTINVLEGLLEYERSTGGTPQSRDARRSGEEFLLERGLFRRLSTGKPADEQFLRFHVSEPVALRRPAGSGLLPFDRRRARPQARCGRRVRSVQAPGRRHLGP